MHVHVLCFVCKLVLGSTEIAGGQKKGGREGGREEREGGWEERKRAGGGLKEGGRGSREWGKGMCLTYGQYNTSQTCDHLHQQLLW